MPSRLAQLIAHNEGYGVPGAIPTVRYNPGDLRHSPHSTHKPGAPNDIGWIDTAEHGWWDLERQLKLFAEEGLTLSEMVSVYLGFPKDAPLDDSVIDGNNRLPYLHTICTSLALPPTATVQAALELG